MPDLLKNRDFQRGLNFNGTYHWASDEPLTKYEMAQMIVQKLNLKTTLILDPNPPSGAPRPKNCQMDCTDLERLGIGFRTPFQQAVQKPLDDFNRLQP